MCVLPDNGLKWAIYVVRSVCMATVVFMGYSLCVQFDHIGPLTSSLTSPIKPPPLLPLEDWSQSYRSPPTPHGSVEYCFCVVFEGLKFDNKLHFKGTWAFFISGTKHNEENSKNIVTESFCPNTLSVLLFLISLFFKVKHKKAKRLWEDTCYSLMPRPFI